MANDSLAALSLSRNNDVLEFSKILEAPFKGLDLGQNINKIARSKNNYLKLLQVFLQSKYAYALKKAYYTTLSPIPFPSLISSLCEFKINKDEAFLRADFLSIEKVIE